MTPLAQIRNRSPVVFISDPSTVGPICMLNPSAGSLVFSETVPQPLHW